MSATFVHYVETLPAVDDGNRRIEVSLGEVGGMTLAYLGVMSEGKQVNTLLTPAEARKVEKALHDVDPANADESPGFYLYRVVIKKYPDGALSSVDVGDDRLGEVNPDWKPDGWEPSEEWLSRFGSKFFWPSTRTEYKSRSSARERARLIESYGATAVVQRSSWITWSPVGGGSA